MRDFVKPLIPLNAAKLAIKSQVSKYFSVFYIKCNDKFDIRVYKSKSILIFTGNLPYHKMKFELKRLPSMRADSALTTRLLSTQLNTYLCPETRTIKNASLKSPTYSK